MGIDLSNVNGAVSKHFLYVADVNISFQQAGGKGMTEHVRRDMHFYRCQGSVLIDHSSDGLVRQCYAGLFDKEVITGLHLRKDGVCIFQYAKDRVVSELDLSLLCTFSIDQHAFSSRFTSCIFREHNSEILIPVAKSSSMTAAS